MWFSFLARAEGKNQKDLHRDDPVIFILAKDRASLAKRHRISTYMAQLRAQNYSHLYFESSYIGIFR